MDQYLEKLLSATPDGTAELIVAVRDVGAFQGKVRREAEGLYIAETVLPISQNKAIPVEMAFRGVDLVYVAKVVESRIATRPSIVAP